MLLLTQIYVQIYWVLHAVCHSRYLTSLTATSEIQKSTLNNDPELNTKGFNTPLANENNKSNFM